MTDPQTMPALVAANATAYADKPMIVDPGAALSHGDLYAGTRELSAGLQAAGVRKGSRIGLLAPNSVDWVRLAVAVTRIGAVLVPLSTLLRPGELRAVLRTAAVQFLISVEEFRGNRLLDDLEVADVELPALQKLWRFDQVLTWRSDATTRRRSDALAGSVRPSDALAVLFTSGSSGAPKATIHSHGSAFGAVRAGLAARCVDADTRLYLPMPFFWVGGFGAGILTTLCAGATLVTEPIPQPSATLKLLRRERVTLFRGWPDQAEALARHGADLPDLRPGSLEALLPASMRGAPGARAKLFGMTETFGPYCGYPADTDMPAAAWGSCGKPFAGTEVRITDLETAVPVPAGESGMIEVRGPHILRGICRRSREEVFTADGFYRTGDLGHLDDDGFLFYRGRSDDMFKVSGATVYPSEVEAALRGVPGVHAAYVTSVPGDKGNRVGALVVGENLEVVALHAAARQNLSAFKVPTLWILMTDDADVPRGSTGKADTGQLREMLTDRGVVT